MVAKRRRSCTGCGGCIDLCPSLALHLLDETPSTDPEKCTDCGICVDICPLGATSLEGNATDRES